MQPLPLRSTGSRRAGSAAMAHGTSRSAARGIFPDRGANPCPLHRQVDSQPLCHQGSLNAYIFNVENVHNIFVSRKSMQNIIGFPGGAVVGSPPADAGDTGSRPGPGGSRVPRSGWAREPWPLSLRVRSLCSALGETITVRGPRTSEKTKKAFICIF